MYATDGVKLKRLCTKDLKLLSVHVAFLSVLGFAAEICDCCLCPPQGECKHSLRAHCLLYTLLMLELFCPKALKFIMGDFNHCELNNILKTFINTSSAVVEIGAIA